MIALVDVGCEETRRLGIGARDDDRRHAAHIGGESGGVEMANVLRCWNENFAAHMAALFLSAQLIFEMNAGDARFDVGLREGEEASGMSLISATRTAKNSTHLHELIAVESAAKSRFGVGDDRHVPIALRQIILRLDTLDLIGAPKRLVDATCELRSRVCRIKRLVGIRFAGRVRVRRYLPACKREASKLPTRRSLTRKVDRLEAGAHHLHRLIARVRAERRHVRLRVYELPELVGAACRQRVFDLDRAAQLEHILDLVVAIAADVAAFRRRFNDLKAANGGYKRLSKIFKLPSRNSWRLIATLRSSVMRAVSGDSTRFTAACGRDDALNTFGIERGDAARKQTLRAQVANAIKCHARSNNCARWRLQNDHKTRARVASHRPSPSISAV